MRIDEALEQGKAAHVHGDRLSARALYKKILEQEPAHAEARHLIGVLELQEGRAGAAVKILESVVHDAPEVFKYALNLALAYIAADCRAEAAQLLERLDAQHPEHPQVLGNLARLAFDDADWARAATLFRRAGVHARRVPEFPMNEGVCLAHMGDDAGARDAFLRAMKLAPASRPVVANMEHALSGTPLAERARFWSEAVERHPQSASAWLALAGVRAQQKMLDEAIMCVQRATARDENLLDAFLLAAQLLHAKGELAQARVMAQRAVLLDDTSKPALSLFARVAQEQRSTDAVDWALDRMLQLFPDDRSTLAARAAQLAARGDMQGVIALFEGVEMTPDLVDIYDLAIASAYDKTDVEQARASLRPILARSPDNEGAVRLFCSLANTAELRAEAVDMLAARPDRPGHEGAYRHFELARLNDKLKRHDTAWAHAVAGNQRHKNPYRTDVMRRELDRVRAVFRESSLLGAGAGGVSQPIFIVGMPRSGTTLTETVLDRHPQLVGVGESDGARQILAALARTYAGDIRWPESALDIAPGLLPQLQHVYNQAVAEDRGTGQLRTVDKMPGNFRYVGLLATVFPGARFVWCKRDWRDNLISLFFGNFGAHHPYAYRLDDIRSEYAIHNAYMQHWRSIGIDIHEHHYTRVVDDFEGAVRDLLEFVGAPFDPDCLDFHESNRVVNTMSFRQVRQPLYRSSLDRWKRYEAQLVDHFGQTTLSQEPTL